MKGYRRKRREKRNINSGKTADEDVSFGCIIDSEPMQLKITGFVHFGWLKTTQPHVTIFIEIKEVTLFIQFGQRGGFYENCRTKKCVQDLSGFQTE